MNQKTKLAWRCYWPAAFPWRRPLSITCLQGLVTVACKLQTHRIHWQFRLGRKHRHSKQFYGFAVRIHVWRGTEAADLIRMVTRTGGSRHCRGLRSVLVIYANAYGEAYSAW